MTKVYLKQSEPNLKHAHVTLGMSNKSESIREMVIGVFDSGIGGLTVVRALMKALPYHDIVYLGDTARTPYGKYLQPLKMKQIDTLILGCTHYPVLGEIIQRKVGSRVALVDSAEAVAEQVREHYQTPVNDGALQKGGGRRCRFFVTDTAEHFRNTARLILKDKLYIEHADL